MMTRFKADLSLPSTKVASFEKEAFLGAASAFGKSVLRPLSNLGRQLSTKYAPKALNKSLRPLADTVEQGLGRATSGLAGPRAGTTAARVLRAAPRNAIREGITGAAIGGVLEGGLNAATAEPGQRGSAFLRGAGSGAVSGALGGAASGMLGGMTRNARGMHMSELAKRNNLSRPELAKQVKGMGILSAARNAFGKTDNLNRQVARHKLVGGAAQIGAETLLPMALLPGGSKESAPTPPQNPALTPNAPNVYYQPQYYKGASAKTRLKPIDFTKIPSYHR